MRPRPFNALIIALVLLSACSGGSSSASKSAPEQGTEEFGLSRAELVQAIEEVEGHIAICMREQGFQYIATDFATVRKGMSADKNIPGMSEEEFVNQYGFGLSTLYTGLPPQLTEGYSPAREGLGERNIEIYRGLSAEDQVAYNRALLGSNLNTTFAYGLETEDFSRTGGCTRAAIEKVFKPEQLKASYYNPNDALINKDYRMKQALRYYAREMHKAGFDYSHPDEVEPDIRERLSMLTQGGTLRVEEMTGEQREQLRRLQDFERRVARKTYQLEVEVFEPVEERIQKEMFSRKVI